MTPEQQQQAAILTEQYHSDLEKYADKMTKLYKLYLKTLHPSVSMADIAPPRGLVDTFMKSVAIIQIRQLHEKSPNRPMAIVEMESFCAGILFGIFLSEMGLASLITREK